MSGRVHKVFTVKLGATPEPAVQCAYQATSLQTSHRRELPRVSECGGRKWRHGRESVNVGTFFVTVPLSRRTAKKLEASSTWATWATWDGSNVKRFRGLCCLGWTADREANGLMKDHVHIIFTTVECSLPSRGKLVAPQQCSGRPRSGGTGMPVALGCGAVKTHRRRSGTNWKLTYLKFKCAVLYTEVGSSHYCTYFQQVEAEDNMEGTRVLQ